MIEEKGIGARITKGVIYVVLVILALSCLLPLIYTLAVSLSAKEAVAAGKVALWPVNFTLSSYKEIMKDNRFFNSFFISVRRVILGTVIAVLVMILAAYPLSKTKREFKPVNIIMWMLVFCMMFSGGTVPWYQTMKSYGLINSVLGLALSGGIPVFNLLLVISFFKNMPKELEEAAMVDGAGPWYILFRILVPLAFPVLATVTLFTLVGHWNEFFQGLVLSTTSDHYPLQTYIQQLVVVIDTTTMTEEQYKKLDLLSNQTLNAAKIFISMVPILVIYPLLQRYFISGIMLGSVKE